MKKNEKKISVLNVFDSIADEYVNYFGDDQEFIDEIKKFTLQLKKDSTILDLGCGNGYITNYLCSLGLNAIGIDFSSKMISIAKKRFPKLNFLLEDFANIESHFEENSVDGLISIYSLYFVPKEQLDEVLKSLSKVLKKGGKFLLITEKGDGEDYITTPLMSENGVENKLYVNYYKKDKLEEILISNNFSIDYIKQKYAADEKEISDVRYIVLATNKK